MLNNASTEIIIYQTEDCKTKIDVRLENETVWMTQKAIAELYQTTPQNIILHIKNIYEEGELEENSTCKNYLQVQTEGNRMVQRNSRHYNLDMIGNQKKLQSSLQPCKTNFILLFMVIQQQNSLNKELMQQKTIWVSLLGRVTKIDA